MRKEKTPNIIVSTLMILFILVIITLNSKFLYLITS